MEFSNPHEIHDRQR